MLFKSIFLSLAGIGLAILLVTATPALAGEPEHATFLQALDADIATLSKKRDFRSQVKLVFELHVRAQEHGMTPETIADINVRMKTLDDTVDREIMAGFLCGGRKISTYKDLFAGEDIPKLLDWSNAYRTHYDSGMYTGKDEDLVSFFNQRAFESYTPEVDCLWLEKSPGLFNIEKSDLHGIVYANIKCAKPPFVLPKSLNLDKLAGIFPLWFSSRLEEKMIYSPQSFINTEKFDEVAGKPLLKWWSLYSLWNFDQYQLLQPAWHQAISDLEAHYKSLPVFKDASEKDIHSAAYFAVMDYIGHSADEVNYPRGINPNKQEIREAILFDVPLETIRAEFDRCAAQPSAATSRIADYLVIDANEMLGTPDPAPFLAVRRPDVLKLLLEKCGYSTFEKNRFGKTLLMDAAQYGPLQSGKIILQDISPDKKMTFINEKTDAPFNSEAQECGNPCMPRGTPVSIKHGNRTALMYAAENASAEFIEWLLEQGADKCLKDSEGLVAADYLAGNGPAKFVNPHLDAAARRGLAEKLSCKNQ